VAAVICQWLLRDLWHELADPRAHKRLLCRHWHDEEFADSVHVIDLLEKGWKKGGRWFRGKFQQVSRRLWVVGGHGEGCADAEMCGCCCHERVMSELLMRIVGSTCCSCCRREGAASVME
jgi:hypothetical protein